MRAPRAAVVAAICLAMITLARAEVHADAGHAELIGRWEVQQVLPDLADQSAWEMRPDNPALMFRELLIAEDQVRFGDEDARGPMRWNPSAATWAALFRKAFLRAPGPSRGIHPTPEDFKLGVCGDKRVSAFLLPSLQKGKVKSPWLHGEWIALKDENTLVMHYSDRVLLVLRRLATDSPPQASFPCDKASTTSEKAICGSTELAGWDRSVAEGLRQLMAWKRDETAALLAAQATWKKARDACGSDARCLGESLRVRTLELANQ